MKFRNEISESLTLKFAEAVRIRRNNGEDIISLGIGEPDFKTPDSVIDATINVLKSGNSKYSTPLGLQELRCKISERFNRFNHSHYLEKNILISAGAKTSFEHRIDVYS